MYVFIAADGQLSLRDSDNMHAFSIVEAHGGAADEWLAANAVPAEEQHYWLDATVVLEISGRQHDKAWVQAFGICSPASRPMDMPIWKTKG